MQPNLFPAYIQFPNSLLVIFLLLVQQSMTFQTATPLEEIRYQQRENKIKTKNWVCEEGNFDDIIDRQISCHEIVPIARDRCHSVRD